MKKIGQAGGFRDETPLRRLAQLVVVSARWRVDP
jgi:hypothetical protein